MVLQREMPIRLRGWADPGERVTVEFGDTQAETLATQQGTWEVTLPEQRANTVGQNLVFQSTNRIVLDDVLVGEVWLCSGQSNMEWTVAASERATEEIANANYPLIRHMKVGQRPSTTPLDDVESQWQVCTPDVVGGFTACGYFMALRLMKDLNVPIGLINSSWGGTRVEPWIPTIGFAEVPALAEIHESVLQKTPGSRLYRDNLQKHLQAVNDWMKQAKVALADGGEVSPSPAFPDFMKPFQSHQDPTMLYNGMIHALVGFSIRGAIWYQGESNHTEGMLYLEKKKALIQGWRTLWGQAELPFYYVQIAPFQYGREDPSILAEFWEAQEAVEQIPSTGMVVINDIATINDIHPPNKKDVGDRLAMLALRRDYGFKDVVADRPVLSDLQVLEGQLRLQFRNTGGGLKTRDGRPPSHFEIIGAGTRGYRPADAKIEGDAIVLTATGVNTPVACRFAWNKLAEPNLVGGTGLPVGAFRSGEEPDFLSVIAIEGEYKLVYDVDLAKIGKDIPYSYDASESIGSFDRIGYLLELQSEQYGDQKLFVAMDAFSQDASQIGIPTFSKEISFRQAVRNVDVFTTVSGIPNGVNVGSGSVEFWPNNYAPANTAGVVGASSSRYDFGDEPSSLTNGYGCMQVHLPERKITLFSINHWSEGASADLGIGNSSGEHSDWTFAGNASVYREKRLRVYVRETK